MAKPLKLPSHALQSQLKGLSCGIIVIPGKDNTGNIESKVPENIDQADHIQIVGYAQIPTDLVLLNIRSVDGDDHFHLVFQLQQHPQLAVRLKAGKHAGCVIIVIQFSAKLQIELSAELGNPLPDVAGLHLQVLIIIKCPLHHE